jgi:glycopeptide antibiotics resistance protein
MRKLCLEIYCHHYYEEYKMLAKHILDLIWNLTLKYIISVTLFIVNSVSALEAVIKYELSLGKILIKFLVYIREDLT